MAGARELGSGCSRECVGLAAGAAGGTGALPAALRSGGMMLAFIPPRGAAPEVTSPPQPTHHPLLPPSPQPGALG